MEQSNGVLQERGGCILEVSFNRGFTVILMLYSINLWDYGNCKNCASL